MRQDEYDYKETKKPKTDDLTRVTLKLKNQKSSAMTVLADKYEAIEKLQDEVNEKRDVLNVQIKDKFDELFNESDKLATRVIESKKWALTVSKTNLREVTTKIDVNYEGAYIELLKLLNENVEPALKEILKTLSAQAIGKYSATKTIVKEPVPHRLTYNKLDESFISDIWKKIKSVISFIKEKLNIFDSKFESLKKKYSMNESKILSFNQFIKL